MKIIQNNTRYQEILIDIVAKKTITFQSISVVYDQ